MLAATFILKNIRKRSKDMQATIEREELLKVMAGLIPNVIWIADAQGNFTYLNDRWVELTGKETSEGLGNKWVNFIHPEDRESTYHEFMQHIAEGKVYSGRFRFRNTRGKHIRCEANAAPGFDEKGQLTGYVGVLQSLEPLQDSRSHLETGAKEGNRELTRTNEELRRSEERYHQMIREVRDYAIILLDMDGTILDWNKGAEKIKGYAAGEIIGKNFRLFYPKEDVRAKLPELLLNEALRNGSVYHEGWRIRKDGNRFWGSVAITALHDQGGLVIGFSKVTRDLTERKIGEDRFIKYADELKQKNEDLRQSEQRYHRMISEVQDYAIILLSKEGDIENWNAGAESIQGYSSKEIMGKNFRVFYPMEDRDRKLPETLLDEAGKKGKAIHEGWRVRKDGSKFWGSVVITALHDPQNNIIGYSKVTRDLTEKREAEEALREKNRELEKMNQELSSFAYVSSHDLQEPLRKIQTFSTRILDLEEGKFSEKGRDYFGRIQSAAHRMRSLIEDLLAYSRANTSERKLVPTDLNELLQDVRNELEETIEEKKATVEWSGSGQLNVIPFQFHQLMVNLLSNALKFSKKDVAPHVVIEAVMVSGDRIKTMVKAPHQSYHHISVSDNGIGFEPAYQTKVFEIFQRLHNRFEYEGTGVGLAICKKIVENHGGLITAEGKVNEGATFHVYLPVLDSQAPIQQEDKDVVFGKESKQ